MPCIICITRVLNTNLLVPKQALLYNRHRGAEVSLHDHMAIGLRLMCAFWTCWLCFGQHRQACYPNGLVVETLRFVDTKDSGPKCAKGQWFTSIGLVASITDTCHYLEIILQKRWGQAKFQKPFFINMHVVTNHVGKNCLFWLGFVWVCVVSERVSGIPMASKRTNYNQYPGWNIAEEIITICIS